VGIREQTHNRKGLQDALRGILDHGGRITEDWEIEKALTVGDKSTGTNVLQQLYKQMADKPSPVDLEQLWKKLGLSVKNGSVITNNSAPEAAIRESITASRK
jgi:predicted metalloprotease with PDZ domain